MDRNFCKLQVQRLATLDFFPVFAPAITELIETLADVARDEGHARAVIDECVQQHGCPEPRDIRRIAIQLRPLEAQGCEQCRDTGFISGTHIVRGIEYDFARRCACNPARAA